MAEEEIKATKMTKEEKKLAKEEKKRLKEQEKLEKKNKGRNAADDAKAAAEGGAAAQGAKEGAASAEAGNASGSEGGKAPAQKEKMTKEEVVKEFIDWIIVIVIAVLVSFIINAFIIVNATVPTQSMETTIMAGDRIIGSRLYYLRHEPRRGDIVVFEYPDDPSTLYVKRLIGMPGDHVEIHDGKVFINGEELYEPYLTVTTEGEWGPYDVPEDSYFMLGDNRNSSVDSRYWQNTYVTKDGLVGKAVLKYWKGFTRFNATE